MIDAPEKVIESKTEQAQQVLVVLLTVLYCFCFVWSSLRIADKSLWMDEVLAVWTARLSSASDVISALYHGSEFSPPTYHLLLHALIKVAGSSYVVLRVPSILAVLVSGFCVFGLLRRYFDVRVAAFGLVFSTTGLLSAYALEIRPYSLVVMCFALAVLLWERLNGSRQDLWRIILMTICLAGAVSLHFYGVLFVPCLGMMELSWSVCHHRLRFPVWLGLIVAGASSFCWLPLIRVLSRYNSGDAVSPAYYAQPTFVRLREVYAGLFICGNKQILFLAVTFCLTLAVYALKRSRASMESPWRERHQIPAVRFYIVALVTIAFPFLVFLFASVVTKTFNARYCLIGCLGFSLLIAFLMSRLPAFRSVVIPVLLVACFLSFRDYFPVGAFPMIQEAAAVLASATKPYPIVVSDGLHYLQFAEGLSDTLKSRLVYVTAPQGVKFPDPTNENQVKRWIPIRPDLKIVSAETFLARNPRFYLLNSTGPSDVLTDWLMHKGKLEKMEAHVGPLWLFEAGSGQ